MATAYADTSRALTVIKPKAVNHDDVTEMVRRFEESEQATQTAREKAERDRDYYDGKQWTADEEKDLKKRGQPVVTFNRIQRKVNLLKGLEAQTRKDPKCFPREPGDEGAAQAATDALRYVCDDSNWDQVRSDAFEAIIVEGTGAVMVGAKNAKQGIDPELTSIPWDRFWYDPHSRRANFSDAKYMGIVTWMDDDTALAKWPDAKDIIEETHSQERSSATATYDDRPQFQIWSDPKRKRIRVIEAYYLEGKKWMRCVYTKAGFLEAPEPSPYEDEDKKPSCPIHAISLYVDRDNNRYGEVRAMISPQDEVNKRRSKGLHLINSRQTRISRAAGIEASAAKRELAKPDGVLIADDGEVEILVTGDMAAANFQMLQEAKAEIDLLGPNADIAGKGGNDQSGRAILANQQGGMLEVASPMDRLRQLSLAVYGAIWARVRQYWDGPRWIRVTNDERDIRFVGLNQPKTLKDLMKVAAEGDKNAMQELGQMAPGLAQALQAAAQGDQEATAKIAMVLQSPLATQPVKIENNIGEIDVDISIDEGMDTPTVAAEQFDTLSKMIPAAVGMPPQFLEIWVQASSLRDKDKILDLIKKQSDPAQAQQAQQQQIQAETQTEMMKIQAKGQVDVQKATIDAEARVRIAMIDAQAKREIAAAQAEADANAAQSKLVSDAVKEQGAQSRHDSQMAMEAANLQTQHQHHEDEMAMRAHEAKQPPERQAA